MKSKKKYLFSIIFFVVLLILTFYLLFSNNDMNDVIQNIKNISLKYILLGVILILVYLTTESLYIKHILKSIKCKISLLQGFVYSCIEFYFSAITPSSTGGQPAQAYYMAKDGVPFTKSSVTLLLNTITFKLVLLLLGLFAVIFYPNLIFNNSTLFTVIFIFGIVVNLIVIIICLMLMYSKKWIKNLATFSINLGHKLKFIKDKEAKLLSFNTHLEEYQEGAKYIKEHISVTIYVCFITLIQRMAMFSISYVVYKAFGISGYSYIELMVMQLSVAIAIDSLPLPGGMGASEAMLLLLYNKYFGVDIAVSAMLVTRGLSYYLCLIISGIVVLINHIHVFFITKKRKGGN